MRPVRPDRIRSVQHDDGRLQALTFERGDPLHLDAAFTTRGDDYHSDLAESAGAEIDIEGQTIVDHCLKTSVPGLYAAGCVTPANCQMIIAAGQGVIAGQAINRDLFEESLRRHALPSFGTIGSCEGRQGIGKSTVWARDGEGGYDAWPRGNDRG